MKNTFGPILSLILSLTWLAPTHAAVKRTQAEIDAATRLQVFLDRSDFSPGKIDGYYGDFTLKALALYRQAKGQPAATPAAKPKTKSKAPVAPDVSGLDLSSIEPVYITYTVTEADLQAVGEMPAKVADQAKLKWLPYHSVTEGIAEKFHCDIDFLAQLNPGKTKALKAGDKLSVPNVEPFDVNTVKYIKPGSDVAPSGPANEIEDTAEKGAKNKSTEPPPPTTAVKVDMKTNMLEVLEGDKLIAAYPVTIGSAHTKSPIGDWKIRGVARLPDFRYDEKLLNEGKRGTDSHLLPPGPNNPVGVIWIALNKKGNGLHGTSEPDSIGRSASHGCVRLANWDVVRLAGKVKFGVPVSIH